MSSLPVRDPGSHFLAAPTARWQREAFGTFPPPPNPDNPPPKQDSRHRMPGIGGGFRGFRGRGESPRKPSTFDVSGPPRCEPQFARSRHVPSPCAIPIRLQDAAALDQKRCAAYPGPQYRRGERRIGSPEWTVRLGMLRLPPVPLARHVPIRPGACRSHVLAKANHSKERPNPGGTTRAPAVQSIQVSDWTSRRIRGADRRAHCQYGLPESKIPATNAGRSLPAIRLSPGIEERSHPGP
jgi:hypothetical protein